MATSNIRIDGSGSREITYEFHDWSIDALAGALRAMAFEDPNNKHKLRMLEECAQRLLMMDSALALSGNSVMMEDRFYRDLAQRKNKIMAIKKYREDKGCSLKDAKEYIDGLL